MVDNRGLKIGTLPTPHQEGVSGSGVRTGFGTGPGTQHPAVPCSSIQAREDGASQEELFLLLKKEEQTPGFPWYMA